MRIRAILLVLALALAGAAAPPPDDSLYNLSQSWTRQDNVAVPLDSLRGRVVVAAMGYATCKQMCPALIADMMWLDKHLPADVAGRVSFAFFSFDSVADTPERLSLYAEGHGLDLAHWSLYAGDPDTVRELAAALGVGFRPDEAGGFDHTAVISVIAPDGRILYQQKGAEAHPDALLTKAIAAARDLN
ncbi:MAG: SCO family protein [Pseudomonadota bacterium]|nr:SCO family protein [Pseudomonadota bacterium]